MWRSDSEFAATLLWLIASSIPLGTERWFLGGRVTLIYSSYPGVKSSTIDRWLRMAGQRSQYLVHAAASRLPITLFNLMRLTGHWQEKNASQNARHVASDYPPGGPVSTGFSHSLHVSRRLKSWDLVYCWYVADSSAFLKHCLHAS